ncbi:MAG TPA: UDP-glucose/GDP-mannose dehydrogenase family protein [Terriglobales bacterium]|nr:UDP-glucose/GDP-mannose dehydrogenase family protein [Terriglobales bacterium]
MRITVVGSGYVGLVASACFAELGHEVISVDNDAQKTAKLQRGEIPIHEQFLPELLARHRNGRVCFSSDLAKAVEVTDAIFIAVGTPQGGDGYADLSYVESVTRELARSIKGYKLIVEKSTVPVFTHDWVRKVMLLNGARADSFDVASNPEFLREGTAVSDFMYPDRIVIGADTPRAAAMLREIYAPLTTGEYYSKGNPIPAPDNAQLPPRLIETSAKSAELIKHACNAFLATKISFINAVANMCESVGADVRQVCDGIGADSRIGHRFLNPGIGYGGSCFPKDLMAFRAVARECGYDFRLLDEVININEDQRHRFLRKVRKALWTLRGKRLGILGLAFKGGTDDIRESPAIAIAEMLLKEGCTIQVYDPAAMQSARQVLPASGVTYTDSAYDAAKAADALLILTDWAEFGSLDLGLIRSALAYPIIVDGRNLYDPATMASRGFQYYSVGRADVEPASRPAAATMD